ncbi:Uncharacterised protein [Mycoplasmopsis citelli]|uniref:Transmembrane protein n=1 Tax=Mycoplasmopsis citelli TaxID=171281 RepID=A0A449B2Z3_9BACT|nr:Uncharacterised protein [Mycoplasmopsis citelli]
MNLIYGTYINWSIFFAITCLFFLFYLFYRAWWIKINEFLYSFGIKKIKFCLENKIKVHPFFVKGIESICKSFKTRNLKIIYQYIISILLLNIILSLLIWLSWVPDSRNLQSVNIKNFYLYIFNIIFLILLAIAIAEIVFWIIYVIIKILHIKKLQNLSKKLKIDVQSPLFDLTISRKEILNLNIKGSLKNFQNYKLSVNSNKQQFFISNLSTNKLVKNYNESILWNRDVLKEYLNDNKEDARYIHYLLIVYSNRTDAEFYDVKNEDNIQFFMELEKYY